MREIRYLFSYRSLQATWLHGYRSRLKVLPRKCSFSYHTFETRKGLKALILTFHVLSQENYEIRTHRTQAERCRAACEVARKIPGCPVVVDTMLDAANIAYGALPIRFHIVQNGRAVYEGGPGPMGYDMKGVKEWLGRYTAKSS